jgi:Tfp pilus assembly protein PilF
MTTQPPVFPKPALRLRISNAAVLQQAQRLFHQRHYGRAAKLLTGIASRESLSPAEQRMLSISLARRTGGMAG